jgi:ribosomal protein S18 acetylase RimI-like enzyme
LKLMIDNIEVGSCNLEIEKNKSAFITDVIIYEKYRGKGYCEQLIKKTISRAKEENIITIKLHVKSDNIAAQKCYSKCGFIIVRQNYDDAGELFGELFGYTMELILDDIMKIDQIIGDLKRI